MNLIQLIEEFNRNLLGEVSYVFLANPIMSWDTGFIKWFTMFAGIIGLVDVLMKLKSGGSFGEALLKYAFWWIIVLAIFGEVNPRSIINFDLIPAYDYTTKQVDRNLDFPTKIPLDPSIYNRPTLDRDVYNVVAQTFDGLAQFFDSQSEGTDIDFQGAQVQDIMIFLEQLRAARVDCTSVKEPDAYVTCLRKYIPIAPNAKCFDDKGAKVACQNLKDQTEEAMKQDEGFFSVDFLGGFTKILTAWISYITLAVRNVATFIVFPVLLWIAEFLRSVVTIYLLIVYGFMAAGSLFFAKMFTPLLLIPSQRGKIYGIYKTLLATALFGFLAKLFTFFGTALVVGLKNAVYQTLIPAIIGAGGGNATQGLEFAVNVEAMTMLVFAATLAILFFQIVILFKIPSIAEKIVTGGYAQVANIASQALGGTFKTGMAVAGAVTAATAAAATGGAALLASGAAAAGKGAAPGLLKAGGGVASGLKNTKLGRGLSAGAGRFSDGVSSVADKARQSSLYQGAKDLGDRAAKATGDVTANIKQQASVFGSKVKDQADKFKESEFGSGLIDATKGTAGQLGKLGKSVVGEKTFATRQQLRNKLSSMGGIGPVGLREVEPQDSRDSGPSLAGIKGEQSGASSAGDSEGGSVPGAGFDPTKGDGLPPGGSESSGAMSSRVSGGRKSAAAERLSGKASRGSAGVSSSVVGSEEQGMTEQRMKDRRRANVSNLMDKGISGLGVMGRKLGYGAIGTMTGLGAEGVRNVASSLAREGMVGANLLKNQARQIERKAGFKQGYNANVDYDMVGHYGNKLLDNENVAEMVSDYRTYADAGAAEDRHAAQANLNNDLNNSLHISEMNESQDKDFQSMYQQLSQDKFSNEKERESAFLQFRKMEGQHNLDEIQREKFNKVAGMDQYKEIHERMTSKGRGAMEGYLSSSNSSNAQVVSQMLASGAITNRQLQEFNSDNDDALMYTSRSRAGSAYQDFQSNISAENQRIRQELTSKGERNITPEMVRARMNQTLVDKSDAMDRNSGYGASFMMGDPDSIKVKRDAGLLSPFMAERLITNRERLKKLNISNSNDYLSSQLSSKQIKDMDDYISSNGVKRKAQVRPLLASNLEINDEKFNQLTKASYGDSEMSKSVADYDNRHSDNGEKGIRFIQDAQGKIEKVIHNDGQKIQEYTKEQFRDAMENKDKDIGGLRESVNELEVNRDLMNIENKDDVKARIYQVVKDSVESEEERLRKVDEIYEKLKNYSEFRDND